MSLKRLVNDAVERLTGVRIYRVPPRGVHVASDIAHALPGYDVTMVLDVGANVGQSATAYLRCFPKARIYCFEPVLDTFRQLQRNLQGRQQVHCAQVALGSFTGSGRMVLRDRSERNSLVDREPADERTAAEAVTVTTLDEFCSSNGIHQVSYLKIDTEGGDLDVLRGAERMLLEQRIDLVQVEAGMHANNRTHVAMERLKDHLESKRYVLFGIYTQVPENKTHEPHLRRANCVFISQRLIDIGRRASVKRTA